MAPRIRSIKPTLWDSETLGKCSMLARLTFIGMISLADDEGRGRAGARFLLGRIHTWATDVQEPALESALTELGTSGCAIFYEIEGVRYYYLPGWKGNQLINRPSPSILPPPPGQTDDVAPASAGLESAPPLDEDRRERPVFQFAVAGTSGPSKWPLWSAKIVEYRLSFPGVDVEGECRKAWQWCEDNAAGRKPYDQMASFLSRWLAKEYRKIAEGKEAAKSQADQAKAAARCRKCSTAQPMNDKWPYCADCTWCAADCGRTWPTHKSFKVKGGLVHCNVCADEAKETA